MNLWILTGITITGKWHEINKFYVIKGVTQKFCPNRRTRRITGFPAKHTQTAVKIEVQGTSEIIDPAVEEYEARKEEQTVERKGK